MTSPVEIRVARADEHGRAQAAYERWGYNSAIRPADVVFVAERAGELVGVVRLTLEERVRMLRGMQVAPAEQRRGTGTRLLHELAARIGDDEICYCVPFAHLIGFYGQAGFEEYALDDGPAFLGARIARYRNEGHVVTLMRRPAVTEQRSRRSL